MEKIHGTSAHVGWNGSLYFFSGGESYDMFVDLFDKEKLTKCFSDIGPRKMRHLRRGLWREMPGDEKNVWR
jgi:hypothetical protein